jgi:hypothetical protein
MIVGCCGNVIEMLNILSVHWILQWNLSNPTHQGTRKMCQIVQDVGILRIYFREQKYIFVAGCRKTQVSDCTSSTVFIIFKIVVIFSLQNFITEGPRTSIPYLLLGYWMKVLWNRTGYLKHFNILFF